MRHRSVDHRHTGRIVSHFETDAIGIFHEQRSRAAEMLQSLREGGIRLALVSSDSEANARLQLKDSAACFSDFACGASLFGKTAKFKRMMKRAGILPSRTIAIGDEMRDLDAAAAAGIAFGGVAWGYADPEALRARNPQMWFDSFADIPRLLVGGRAHRAATSPPSTNQRAHDHH